MVKGLNLKNMIEEYKNAKCKMEKVWETFYNMHMMGFISSDTWAKFFDKCKDLHYEEDALFDGAGNVIKRF